MEADHDVKDAAFHDDAKEAVDEEVYSENEVIDATERVQEQNVTKNSVNMLPLDWTKQSCDKSSEIKIRYPFDVADISMEETDLVLVGTAGQKITNLGPDFSKKTNPLMNQLVIRSHLLRKMEGLENYKQLDLLEFYDNQIDSLDSLNGGIDGAPGSTLRVLDMSFNVIREMKPVELCPNLQELCKYANFASESNVGNSNGN